MLSTAGGEILSIMDSTIFNNSASRSGGAVFFTGDTELTRCTVRNNSAYMGSAFRSLSYTNNPRLMDCDIFGISCEESKDLVGRQLQRATTQAKNLFLSTVLMGIFTIPEALTTAKLLL